MPWLRPCARPHRRPAPANSAPALREAILRRRDRDVSLPGAAGGPTRGRHGRLVACACARGRIPAHEPGPDCERLLVVGRLSPLQDIRREASMAPGGTSTSTSPATSSMTASRCHRTATTHRRSCWRTSARSPRATSRRGTSAGRASRTGRSASQKACRHGRPRDYGGPPRRAPAPHRR